MANTQTNLPMQDLEQQIWNDFSSIMQQFGNSDNVDSIMQQFNQLPQGFVPDLNHIPKVNEQGIKGMEVSENWAGYIDTPVANVNPYTSVSGTWIVPNNTGSQNSLAAQWIGLGGVTSEVLLQMGTIEGFEQGKEVANVIWEQLPQVAQNVNSKVNQ